MSSQEERNVGILKWVHPPKLVSELTGGWTQMETQEDVTL